MTTLKKMHPRCPGDESYQEGMKMVVVMVFFLVFRQGIYENSSSSWKSYIMFSMMFSIIYMSMIISIYIYIYLYIYIYQ